MPLPPEPGEGFDQLARDGQASVTISGTVEGQSDVTLDFHIVHTEGDAQAPQVIHTEVVKGNSFSIQAPATFSQEIYASAFKDLTGDGATPDDLEGFAQKPFKLEGSNVAVTINFDSRPAWADEIFKPLEGMKAREVPNPQQPNQIDDKGSRAQ